jgi:creatinine amidohydrolase
MILAVLSGVAMAQDKAAVKLEDLTQPEVRARDVRVLLLPIGSTEPHANHLGYGNDARTAGALAALSAARANQQGARVLVLPTMPYGVNTNLVAIPYAQSIRPATMMQFVKDVVDTAEKQGIRKLVILNTHGGNKTALGAVLRELFATNPRVFVALIEGAETFQDQLPGIIESPGEHASEAETSVALALFPDTVRMDKAAAPRNPDFRLKSLQASYITFVRPWKYVSDTTGHGDPTKATAEKGRKLVDVFVDRISALLKELSDAAVTETFPY